MNLDMRQREILAGARVLSSLTPPHFEMALDAMTPLRLTKGQLLCVQGEVGDTMAILGSGRLGVSLQRPDGKLESIGELRPGAVVGEMSCLDPARRSAMVIALEPSLVMTLSRESLEELRLAAPAVAAAIVGGTIEELALRLRATNQRILDIRRQAGEVVQPPLSGAGHVESPRGGPLPAGVRIDLDRVPLLKGMTHRDLDLLTSVAPPLAFPAGTVLCKEGTSGTACYLLLDGEVEVVRGEAPQEEILATLSPRTLVGQLSLIDKAPRSATVRAKGAIIAQQLHRDVFERLLAAASPLGLRFQQQLAVSGIRQLRAANSLLTAASAKRDARHRKLVYVQTALDEWTLPLEELEEVVDLVEDTLGEDTADMTELFNFQELSSVDESAPTVEIEISAVRALQGARGGASPRREG